MNRRYKIVALIVPFAMGTVAWAQMPQMGGDMKHIAVHLHQNMLEGHVDPGVPTPVLQNYGESYMPPADVLNGTSYNAQYGWMVEGFWSPPVGSLLWIEQLNATPGLSAYLGGMMGDMGTHTFAPIFGTDGSSSRIAWDGMMLHNWYAVTVPGDYSATYRLYFGDTNGVPTPGYGPSEVTLNWTTVPEPASVVGLALLGVATAFRRRGS
jgi:hypothetical protein